jgi:serine/threonine protein kinase
MAQPSWIGYQLNERYQIKELLGQGGMSSVYRAYDPKLRRDVAVKIIHPHLSEDPKFIRRFDEEGAAVAQLRHPNIRQVFDANHDGQAYYIVLEFLPGETLKDRLAYFNRNGQLMSLQEAITIIDQICSAASYAHKMGVIHRDIKPANVIISTQGEAVLTDFGIAKIVAAEQFTGSGTLSGTAAYISPEQAQGKKVDHRADIYAIGVMLFEIVSGRPPFEADSVMSLIMKHVNEPPPDLRQRVPTLHPKLVEIIEKALAKNPDQRYQSAEELAADLSSFLISKPMDRDETLIDQPLQDTLAIEETFKDKPLPAGKFRPKIQVQPPPQNRKKNGRRGLLGIPRHIIELVSAAIGGGTVVVLSLICLIVAAILIIPRIYQPTEPILNPTFFVQPEDGTPEPPQKINFIDLNNDPVSLDDYLGQWLLVNIWRIDCSGCQFSIPHLQAYYQNNKDRNFTVIGINTGDSVSETAAFVEANRMTYPIWMDPNQELIKTLSDDILPSFILISPQGLVQSTFQGSVNQEFLEKYISPLLP